MDSICGGMKAIASDGNSAGNGNVVVVDYCIEANIYA